MPLLLLLALLLLACPAVNAQRVEPLLKGWVRHQLAPFNQALPPWQGASGTLYRPAKVGCVATALESIISFHGRDVVLADTLHGWATPHYSLPDLLPGTRVKVSHILPRYDEGAYTPHEAETVAQLSLICGMMARMNYGLEESGAQPERLVEPMQQLLGWRSVRLLYRADYRPEAWAELLRRELRAGRPVLYTGYTMNLFGHAFVLDGCDEEGRFHFNFGFGGAYDEGWFDLDALAAFENPIDLTPLGIQQGFVGHQAALLLAPDSVDFALPDTLEHRGREWAVEDLRVLQQPEVGIYTPVAMTLRNISAERRNAPCALFTNLPTDTAALRQADYVASYGATLEAGEAIDVVLQAQFAQTGHRLLRVATDDSLFLAEVPVSVVEHSGSDLHFGQLSFSLPDSTTARLSLPITNRGTARSGHLITFCLMPDTTLLNEGDYRHYAYATLAPGETQTFSVDFRHLRPGSQHRLVVRSPWTVQTSLVFAVPSSPAAIEMPLAPASQSLLYDLTGRPAALPRAGQILLQGRRKFILHP